MTTRPRVFVTRRIPRVGIDRLNEVADVAVWPGDLPPSVADLQTHVAGCHGLLSLLTDPVTAAVMDASPQLRVISNYAVGFNNIDIAAATARDIRVGNTPGVLTEATADIAFALLIAAARCVRVGSEDVAAGRWRTWEPMGYLGQELTGKTLGVIGLGRIGTAMARRCRGGWGMSVVYHNTRRNAAAEAELGATWLPLDELLAVSDFVSLHCPLTAENRCMFGSEQFRKMKRSAVFVNTARGALVDQAALAQALRDGVIFAAGIDVTDPEPPAVDDPLLKLPNLVVVPHIASATFGTREKMAVMAADNIIAGLQGRALPNAVN